MFLLRRKIRAKKSTLVELEAGECKRHRSEERRISDMEFWTIIGLAIRLVIFMLFILTAAWQDCKTGQVSLRLFQIFGAAGLVICLSSGIQTAAELWDTGSFRMLPELIWKAVRDILLGMLPGISLFLFFKSGGEIGEGDCAFFLICGWYTGMWDTCFVLAVSVFLCGLAGLVYYVMGCMRGNLTGRYRGKTRWPFLPFTVLPGAWIVVMRLSTAVRMSPVLNGGGL